MNQSSNQNNQQLQGWEAPLVVCLVGGGIWTKYGLTIKLWLHENMVSIVLGAMVLVSLCGYWLVCRMKKKKQVEHERLRNLASAQAPLSRDPRSYYARRDQVGQQNSKGRDAHE